MTCHTLVSQPQSSHPWNISLKHYYRRREHSYIGYPYEKAYSGTRFFPWQFLEFQCRQFVRSLCVSRQRRQGFFTVPWSNDTAVPLGAGLPSYQAAVLYQDKTAISAKQEIKVKNGIFFVSLHRKRLFRYLIAFMQLFSKISVGTDGHMHAPKGHFRLEENSHFSRKKSRKKRKTKIHSSD